jgi:hypothetical protein
MGKIANLVGTIASVRNLSEESAFKDWAAKNPDWASNPSKISEAIAIAPSLGFQLADRAGAVAQQQQARAGQKLLFMQRADDMALDAHNQAIKKGAPSSPEFDEGPGSNWAAAHEAGNDAYQRMRVLAKDLYGTGFADGLPATWSLDDYAQRAPIYDRVMDSMRKPMKFLVDDGKGGKQVQTVPLIPGAEDIQWLKQNKGLNPIPLPEGEFGQSIYMRQGPGGVATSLTGKQEASELQASTKGEREFFANRLPVQNFLRADPVYSRGTQAIRMGTKTGDQQAAVALALLDNPAAVATEGGVQTIASPGLLSNQTQQYINLLNNQAGQWTPEQRRNIANAMDTTYDDYRKQFLQQRQDAEDREAFLNVPKGTITGAAPVTSEQELERLRRLPFNDNGAATASSAAAPPPADYQRALNVAKSPGAPVDQFVPALRKLNARDFYGLNTKQMSDDQLRAYVTEGEKRKRKQSGKGN